MELMDKRGGVICAFINSNVEELDRTIVKEEFSKFGNVRKIFIDGENKWGKVYFEDLQSVQRACKSLNGYRGWEVKRVNDDYTKTRVKSNKLHLAEGRNNDYDSFSGSNSNSAEMEQECVYAAQYVDVHGRPIEVLQAENGQLFVNLDDVRATGFNIYLKESFENAVITKDVDLRHFENYLLNQGKKYILEFKQRFNEDEMLNVFERVRAKLQNPDQAAQFGEGRLINNVRAKNFSITTTSNTSTTPENNSQKRSPKQLPANFQPSFSYNKPSKNSPNTHQARQNEHSSSNNDSRRPQNNNANRNRRSNEGFRNKPNENGSNAQGRRFNKSGANTTTTNSAVDVNEPEESWEEETDRDTIVASKSKVQSDTSSISERSLLTFNREKLAQGGTCKVKVSFLPEKNSVFHGHLIENSNLVEEILLHVNTEDCKLPVINKPVRDMLCIAQYEECWHRAVVLHERTTPGCAYVEFIDYGNREDIKEPVREMSDAMKSIPGQAIRCTFSEPDPNSISLKLNQQLEIFVRKHYDDLTHLVQIKNVLESREIDDEPASSPSEPSSDLASNVSKPKVSLEEECFTEVPPSTTKIQPDETVIVVNYTENKLILRNKETATICKSVYAHLKEMQKKPITNPKVGQLVLCSRDTDEGLHRAVIRKITDKAAELEFVDYYGGETLALKSLRNMDKVLSSFPSAKIEFAYPVLEHLTENSDALLQDLVFQKKKIKTTQVKGAIDFLITDGDNTVLLSEKIKQLGKSSQTNSEQVIVPSTSNETSPPSGATKPETKKSVDSPPSVSNQLPASATPEAGASQQESSPVIPQSTNEEEDGQIDFDSIPCVTVKRGLGDYSFFNCKGDSVTIISVSEENAPYLEAIDIGEPADKVPYGPAILEMCLAKFEDVWYRALATEIQENDTFEILFVDYGNVEIIKKTDLRRFPKNLATIPLLGIDAYFVGIPETPAVYSRLKELISEAEGSVLEVNVKTDIDSNNRYGIEVPSVYETLKKEGLM